MPSTPARRPSLASALLEVKGAGALTTAASVAPSGASWTAARRSLSKGSLSTFTSCAEHDGDLLAAVRRCVPRGEGASAFDLQQSGRE